MNFNESLTVRIEGDSSGLDTALEASCGGSDELQGRLQRVGSAASGLDGIASRLTAAVAPAESFTRSLDRVTASIQANRTDADHAEHRPGARGRCATQRAVGGNFFASAGMGSGKWGRTLRESAVELVWKRRKTAAEVGGRRLVRGPSGTDRVPAWLTAGEYVVSRPAVERVGLDFLEGLNNVGVAGAPGGGGDPVAAGSEGPGSSVPRGESRVEVTDRTWESPRTVGVTVVDAGRGRLRRRVHGNGTGGNAGGESLWRGDDSGTGGGGDGAVVRELRTQGLAARNRRGERLGRKNKE